MATAVQFGNIRRPARAKAFTRAEAESLFDRTAMMYLGISGSEFLRRWDNGEYANEALCTSRVMRVATMIPLVRRERAGENTTNRPR